ncbi:MAG TPA: V-type ATP synthase subunit C [Thermoanaerobacterales bacterium]|nr:V-type ATP synthase subunit C [Thermoanaerobacterales bacterium]
MSKNAYLYAVGRVKALETKLLSKSTFERMLEAPTAQDALKVLGETDYGISFGDAESVYDFEKIIYSNLKKTYKVVDESTKNPLFTRMSTLKYDFHNLKVLIKGEYLGDDYQGITMDLGNVSIEKIARAVRDMDYKDLPVVLKQAAEEAVVDFELQKDPQRIDIILDKHLFKAIYQMALETGHAFALEIAQTEIDLININIFVRCRRMGRDVRFLETALLDNGILEKSLFIESYNEPLSAFTEKLFMGRYGEIAAEGIQSLEDTNSTTILERMMDDFLLNKSKKGKYATSGVEPIIGYIKAKENEGKIIRTIMVGKINNVPADKIRERLRDVYV